MMNNARESRGQQSSAMGRFGRKVATVAAIFAGVAAAGTGIRILQCQSFQDLPGPGEEGFGREVNSLSALLMGTIAEQIQSNATFEGTVVKPWYADAPVAGHVAPGEVDSLVTLNLTSAHFHATGMGDAHQGKIEKSEFDWQVRQTGPHTWEIGRFGLKLDKELKIVAEGGKIRGEVVRAFAWDWSITGSYTDSGNVQMHISTAPLEPSFDIIGTVHPK